MRVPAGAAMDHVAGYVVVNDVSARAWQGSKAALGPGERGDGQWLRAKGSELIEFVSKAITLEPGDLIATGTPAGVGVFHEPPVFLEPGDRARCEIEGIGWVENPVVDWTAMADRTDDTDDVNGITKAPGEA